MPAVPDSGPTEGRNTIDSAASGFKSVVYVVDDDGVVRIGLSNLLESVGHHVEAYSSTTEFLATFRMKTLTTGSSCLVLDIRLPGPSGLDLQAELLRSGFEIPIVFITGYADIPMTVRAMKSGAVEFLTKPVREQDLLDAVQTALERDRARRHEMEAAAKLHARYETLNSRERPVIDLVARGRLNKQVAAEIGLSEISVKVCRHKAMQKLGAKSLPDLVRMVDELDGGMAGAKTLGQ